MRDPRALCNRDLLLLKTLKVLMTVAIIWGQEVLISNRTLKVMKTRRMTIFIALKLITRSNRAHQALVTIAEILIKVVTVSMYLKVN